MNCGSDDSVKPQKVKNPMKGLNRYYIFKKL